MQHKRDFAVDRRVLTLIALAVPIGAMAVAAAAFLLALIHLCTNLFYFQRISFTAVSPADSHLGLWAIALPVLGGLIVGLMARYGSSKIRGHGIPEAIEAILFGKSKLSFRVAALKPLSSAIVIGSGGPFGAEGPIIMTGGSIGSLIAQHIHLSAAERKTLLVAGATAGMTAVFGTPIAAVLLAVELLLFELRPRSLVPVALACAVAGFLRGQLLSSEPLFAVHTPEVTPTIMWGCVLAGLASGVLCMVLSWSLYRVEDLFGRLPLHWMWWPALGGLAIGVGGYFEPRALGIGFDVISDLLNKHLLLSAALALLAVKAIIWVIALGSGTSGGVLAPLLMLGAGLGAALAHVLPGGQGALWPLVCMAATLAGVLGAPLTATVFALGLSHDLEALLPLLLTVTVAYALTVLVAKRSIMTEKIARRGLHIYREYSVDPLERHEVGEIMTRQVQTLDAECSLEQAQKQVSGSSHVHRVYPVVDRGRLLGMVNLQAMDSDAECLGDLFTEPPLFSLPGENCRHLAGRLLTLGLERMAVVNDEHSLEVVGIVSRSDLLKTSIGIHEEENVREQPLRWGITR